MKTSSRQLPSKFVKEKNVSPSAKFQDERKVEKSYGPPYVNRHQDLRRCAGEGLVVEHNVAGNQWKQQFGNNTNDELVKHMSNLPGYLQRMERGENLQGKALNFGVLDWERLEKWKYDEKVGPSRGDTRASSSRTTYSFEENGSSRLSSSGQSKNPALHMKQSSSHVAQLKSFYEQRISNDVQQSQGKVVRVNNFNTVQTSTLDRQQNLSKSRSSARNYSAVKLDRGKRKELGQGTTRDNESSFSDCRKPGFPLSPPDTINAQEGKNKARLDEEINTARQHSPTENHSIVLLLPKFSSRKSESFQPPESRASFEEKFGDANGKRFSDCSYLEELYSEIPHSCPLPVSVGTDKSDMKRHSLIKSQGVEVPTEVNANVTSKGLDDGVSEQPASKGSHPSPNRRFSFSLGRMSRSFSFKEGSTTPQLSPTYVTVKSGPVRSEASSSSDHCSREEVKAISRARSSPLRRLLDPLLKPRGARSAETQPSKANLKSRSVKPMNASELLQDNRRHEESNVQALLQLTLKNGLPFFKLAVDNSSEILAAAVKKLPTSEEEDADLIYAFYSVHEIRKKSGGWMNQVSKGKSGGFGYKIVGQMKVSSPNLPDLIGHNSKDQYVVRESVLYGVDLGHADKETPEFISNRELASIVVKNQSEKKRDGEDEGEGNFYFREGFTDCSLEDSCKTRENENSKSIQVILPGGTHGMPDQGLPSPLIKRWRSGSCDCGGWDLGCKLRILSDHDQISKNSKQSICRSTTDCLELFVQGGHQENKPLFSLSPLKNGLYSVEYNASISLLQAFSVCVVSITSQTLSNVLKVNNLSEAKCIPERTTGVDAIKTPNAVPKEVPAKFAPSPPASPFGRV
ncbi:hypothetical protein RJ640_014309 [Escallonia rubra]|uniref:DUF3527 domain protein n=1 Tax=Escallonia rubra TaxID=112253 RepID=A0AA88R3R6_9ASTE|nr:hypothetical protein RJ640_014309 [Escallonia rubra]